MRFSTESEFNRWVSRQLTDAGAKVLALVGSTLQAPGWPDRYVAHRLYHGWVEGKKDNGTLSTLQRHCIRELRERGVPALVLRYRSEEDLWVVEQTAYNFDFGQQKPGRAILEALHDCWEEAKRGLGV